MAELNLRILWVDDDRFMITAFQYMLGALGCEQFEVVSGRDAGRRALDLIRTVHYDVVITDRKMPDVDGFTVADVVRQVDHFLHRPETPVIMVTISDVLRLQNAPGGGAAWLQDSATWSALVKQRARDLSVSLIHKPLTKARLHGILHLVASLRMQQLPIYRSLPFRTGKLVETPTMVGSFFTDSLNLNASQGAQIIVADPSNRANALVALMQAASKKTQKIFLSCGVQNEAALITAKKKAEDELQAHRAQVSQALAAMGLDNMDLQYTTAKDVGLIRSELARVAQLSQRMRTAVAKQEHRSLPQLQDTLNTAIKSFCTVASDIAIKSHEPRHMGKGSCIELGLATEMCATEAKRAEAITSEDSHPSSPQEDKNPQEV